MAANFDYGWTLIMKLRWRIRDIIDLEYFLHDHEGSQGELYSDTYPQMDRNIYLEYIRPTLIKNKKSINDRKWLLRLWLEQKKNTLKTKNEQKILPGESFHIIFWLLISFAAFAGISAGAGATVSFLLYKGNAPINVSAYIGIFVLLQIALILLTCFLLVMKKHIALFHTLSFTHRLLGALLIQMMFKVKESALSTIPAKERGRLMTAVGLVKGKQSLYGSVFYWPIFILAQIFSISFNIGILIATILKVIGSDLAFGWQSTIQFSSQAVHKAVVLISLPWSWFVPTDVAYPTLEQIEGSRMILKDGLYHLSTAGLISWWPFLCFAVLFYGLVPRLILLLTGLIGQNRSLVKINLHTTTCESLILNLTTPIISTGGTLVGHIPKKESPFDKNLHHGLYNNGQLSPSPTIKVIALVPNDISASCPDDALKDRIAKTAGLSLIRKITFGEDQVKTTESIKHVLRNTPDNKYTGMLILQEAWQPPIRETLLFLSHLRKTIGNKSIIRIGLIGKPSPETIFTPPNQNNIQVWKQAITVLGDPAICIEILGGNNES
jgi:hypothetical protein